MANSYGIRLLDTVGRTIQLLANNTGIRWKPGALTVDWDTVPSVAVPVALEDGIHVEAGAKYLRYGQIMAEITASGKYGPYNTGAADGRQTLTKGKCFLINETVLESDSTSEIIGGLEAGRVWRARLMEVAAYAAVITIDATGGTFTITYNAQTTAAIDWNATAAEVQAALEAISTISAGDILVSQNGMSYTITFHPDVVTVPPFTTSAAGLTGGASTATVTALIVAAQTPTVAIFQAAFPGILFADQ